MIYFVEDDNSIRELVLYTLNNAGYEAKGFEKPSLFWEALKTEVPALILLDIMLPEEDGLQILKKLRSMSQTKKVPIMMLTAKGTEYDKVIGLDYGADDYMPKPFGMMELIARVRALLRRADVVDTERDYSIGNLYLSPSKHIVKADRRGGYADPERVRNADPACGESGNCFYSGSAADQNMGIRFRRRKQDGRRPHTLAAAEAGQLRKADRNGERNRL